MEWYQVLTIVGANLGMFLWATRQARADFLHSDRKIDENRKETASIVKSMQENLVAIKDDMRDFHNRLCEIEQKRNQQKGA